ncbi:CAP domain-containing protein [Parvularcula sp. IMCC14364]|uniref:CAP domain-containing protein n=1 Tax=Parvularcula sp. IMCC14364 TaxID=3067902 RepID=UPI002741ACB7|nr:CAP domain-containing protein [Parvularcula sp. IMCC14364]
MLCRIKLLVLAVIVVTGCEAIPPAPRSLEAAPVTQAPVRAIVAPVQTTRPPAGDTQTAELSDSCACAVPAEMFVPSAMRVQPVLSAQRQGVQPVFRSTPARDIMPRLNLDQAIRMVNVYRGENGLAPLFLERRLVTAARSHAQDLAQVDRVSHTGSDGSTLQTRLQRAGYDAHAAAENISGGQRSFEEAFRAWQQSPVHREKLLAAKAQDIGIAYVYDPASEYRVFWTLIIAERF